MERRPLVRGNCSVLFIQSRMQLGLIPHYDSQHKRYELVPVENDRRFSHVWAIGKTGVGKSTALIRWALEDISRGDGIAFFDPHGETAEALLGLIPKSRWSDVIWFCPPDFPIAVNPFDTVPEERRSFAAAALVDAVKAAWGYADFATPTLDMFLYNGARALIDMPDGTLFGLKFLLTSKTYRKRVLSYCRDPVIADFWRTDFETHMPEREQRERTLSTLNKIGALIADPLIRHCIARPKASVDLRKVIEEGKILIVSLPQGRLGLDKASLIGSLVMSQLQLAALARPEGRRRPFHIFADECHCFGASTLAEMLSGIRKFSVSLTLANQYLDQLPMKLRSALIGTTGTMVAFQLGASDAATLEPEFKLYPGDYSLCELAPYRAYTRSGMLTQLLTMSPIEDVPSQTTIRKLKNLSRARYGVDVKSLDHRIARFMNTLAEPSSDRRRSAGRSREHWMVAPPAGSFDR